jgi:hypothetical protein
MIGRALLVMLLGCTAVLGQTTDTVVTGRIQIPGGGAVGSIPVTLSTAATSTGTTSRVLTDAEGVFLFNNVRPGEYILFAGATMAPLVSGPNDAAQGIVLAAGPAILSRAIGTFFPGTTEMSKARSITVSSGARVENIDFELAPGTVNWAGPQFQSVPVKIVVEGGGSPTFHSDQFGLAFSDSPANVSFTVTFKGGLQKASTRIERTNQPFLVSASVPMPAFPGGEFRLTLPEGVLRVGQVAPVKPAPRPASHVGPPVVSASYYVKSMTFGATDLMKDLMTLRGPTRDTLTITLARCSATTTQEILCQ